MNGGQSQADRVLIDASRSARAHGERHLAALSQERQAELNRDWEDPFFDGGLNFKRQWAEQALAKLGGQHDAG